MTRTCSARAASRTSRSGRSQRTCRPPRRGTRARTGCSSSAGDIMGDRGVRTAVEASGKGPSYLLDGGTSQVDRIKCCSFFGYQYPVVSRTGNAGAVQKVISGRRLRDGQPRDGRPAQSAVPRPDVVHLHDRSVVPPDGQGLRLRSALGRQQPRQERRREGLTTAMSTLDSLGILHAGAGVGPDAAAAR